MDVRYNFKSDPRSVGAIVVLAANESSYSGKHSMSPFSGSSHVVKDNGVESLIREYPIPLVWLNPT